MNRLNSLLALLKNGQHLPIYYMQIENIIELEGGARI